MEENIEEKWEELYKLQSKALIKAKNLKNIVLGGGTTINQYLSEDPMRYSEDLDFFIEPPFDKDNINKVIKELQIELSKDSSFNLSRVSSNDSSVKKFFINDILKIEVLNFNNKRFKNFFDLELVNLENPYDLLLLYKFKAISDRNSISDLFDIWILTNEHLKTLNVNNMMNDLFNKFYLTTDYEYNLEILIKSIKLVNINSLDTNIYLTKNYVDKKHEIKQELEQFKNNLIIELSKNNNINFNYFDRLINNLIKNEYLENINNKDDIIEYLEYVDNDFSNLEKLRIQKNLDNNLESLLSKIDLIKDNQLNKLNNLK